MLSFRPPQSVTMGMVPYRCAHICKHALAAGNSCSLNIFGTDFSESLDRGLKIYVYMPKSHCDSCAVSTCFVEGSEIKSKLDTDSMFSINTTTYPCQPQSMTKPCTKPCDTLTTKCDKFRGIEFSTVH